MCGICASLALPQQGQGLQESILEERRESLATEIDGALAIVQHRGRDAHGQWISRDARVGLGHTRLSIIDLTPSGNQPFDDSENKIDAIVNGELYDHERYKAQLASEYDFVSNSDSEIVIALYKHFGLSFLSHLRGEFALVIWDETLELFLAARDRYGIKPLYYTIVDNRLLVATEMKSFLAFPWRPEWDMQALLDHGWRTDGRTMFKAVRKVLPGHYLICKHFATPEEKCYWDLDYPDKRRVETRCEEEMIAEVREKLIEAVRLRLRADVPVGVYLSGGLDSSAIAGIIAHLIKHEGTCVGDDVSHKTSRLTCLCVAFDKGSGADESDVAQRTTEWLGVKFLPVAMDDEALAAGLEDAVWYSETVMPDANGPGRMAIAAKAHQEGLKVVLTGEGADEHFGGYTWLRPESIREPDYSWHSWENDQFDRAKATQRAENQPDLDFGGHWTSIYSDINQETLMIECLDGRAREAIRTKWHPLHAAQYIHTKTAFPNLLLRYVGDNVDMVHSIESRTPFLDHHLTEYANSIPPSLKMRYDPTNDTFDEKYILKRAVRSFVPDEIFHRKKHSFLGPTRFEKNGPLRKVLEKLLTEANVERLGFIDWEKTKSLVSAAFDQNDGKAFRAAMASAQFVILGQKFRVPRASRPIQLS